ncbi:MAG: ABC transporter permease [Prevotella sp.]
MKLVWKLLRQHISIPQFVGFFFANLFGLFIVLLGYQFYHDIIPVFTSEDSFMKADYLVISKKVGTTTTISGGDNTFSHADIEDFQQQPFVNRLGLFTSANYKSNVAMAFNGMQVLNSEIFFESIPDSFVKIPLSQWKFNESENVVPIILPRSYITMYNFGFARNHSLPKISEGIIGMIDVTLSIHGNGRQRNLKGKVIGFSNRFSSILVPQSFMEWSNKYFAPEAGNAPNRLILDVKNPTDEKVTQYLDRHGYEQEDGNLSAEKTTHFLSLLVTMVVSVGGIISILSFYVLMLSIYLLVQKNAYKLENLMVIGYSPSQVARPYQWLTLGLNSLSLIIAFTALYGVRRYYMDIVYGLFPSIEETTMLPAFLVGLVLLLLITFVNIFIIHRKMLSIWRKSA